MTLKEQLNTKAAATKKVLASEKYSIMDNATNALAQSGITKNALKTGDTVNDFTLENATNTPISLSNSLKNKRVVLSFYRGGWCPYCNMELRALQNILPEIEANNAELIAISPELPDQSLTTSEKNDISFQVLSDVDNKVAKDFGLVFKMPKELQGLYSNEFNIQVDQHNGNNDYELPLAATYIINENGKIIYDFITERYTERAEPADILAALQNN
jgi:peroxiredoxin